VEVGTTSIGMFTTDATGTGSLTLSNLTTTITAGSVLTVVDGSTPPNTVLTGTFAAGGEGDGGDGEHHHHHRRSDTLGKIA